MVENIQNQGGPRPTQPANPMPQANPVVPALTGMAETISRLNGLDFSLVAEVESKRRAIVVALLRDHEALALLANCWERAAAKTMPGD